MNLKNILLIGLASFLLIFPPMTRVTAEDEVPSKAKGKLEVNDCCVTVVNPDGSIVNLDVGATYPLFYGLILVTDETGKFTVKEPGGRYVGFSSSEFTLTDIGGGNAGLSVSEGKMGKACYCFSSGGQYLIQSPPANLKNYAPTTAPSSAGYITESSLGLTVYKDGISYAAQWQGESQFDSNVLEAGDAACKPSCNNPREGLGGLVDCCAPDLVPLYISSSAAAAAVAGAIVGATTISSDNEGTSFIPPPEQ
jgi:hypothetical protein